MIQLLGHNFIKDETYGPDDDYTDLKCSICQFEATLDNYDNTVKDFTSELTDEELSEYDGNRLRISCKEYIIKRLLE